MKSSQKNFDSFIKTLLHWHRENGRDLPWRKKNITPYEVWVSEVMLQQTQVDRVIPFYKQFIKRFPSIRALSRVGWEEFLPYYEGLGYYNRGRNMLETAKIIVSEFDGRFPRNKQTLQKLPGVGEYTANAILAFAHDKSILAVDTNIKRILTRYFYRGLASVIVEFEKWMQKNGVSGREINSGLMDFGSLVCTSRPNRDDHACPFGKHCRCFRDVSLLGCETSKLRQEKFPTREAGMYVFLHKDHREYYSTNKKKYKPFLLLKRGASREAIKKHFLEKYHLVLSVRPPFDKRYISGKPRFFVHAQILSGTHSFFQHKKEPVEIWKKCIFDSTLES